MRYNHVAHADWRSITLTEAGYIQEFTLQENYRGPQPKNMSAKTLGLLYIRIEQSKPMILYQNLKTVCLRRSVIFVTW